ncbi:plasmid encoded RepA protein [Rhizobium sp. TRM95111]|uniref:replication protein RepA n=1 Tax=Rhizobium alarense TaxID=2846851 RepID=UPI001EED0726|nr:replication protein RepA [Rhizobium alarense]MCF3643306.1 plasmid encoded RepA protein [Rhizobium alarense]
MTSKHDSTSRRAASTAKDPFAVQRQAYRAEMIANGFAVEDADIIAAKTVFKQSVQNEPKAIAESMFKVRRNTSNALADLIADLPAHAVPRRGSSRRAIATTTEEKPAKPPKRVETPIKPAVYDYRYDELPNRVRDLIEAHLAIEADDAKAAGTIGFMTRALAIATLPHRRVPEDRFVRKNGDYTLTMLTAHPEGLPYGTLPRLLLAWVCSEAVLKKEPVLSLGNTLSAYLRELGLKNTGGKRGDITRLKHAMTTLFSAIISCRYDGRESWALQNVLLAERVEWWQPQEQTEAGQWSSKLVLSRPFFQECIDHPIPVNMHAMKAFRHSPLALDIYVWLTHRMSYLSKRTTIPWISLSSQFGAGYASNEQGLRDFRRAFLRELKHVVAIYNDAKLAATENGLVLYPSPTHVPPKLVEQQASLPFF